MLQSPGDDLIIYNYHNFQTTNYVNTSISNSNDNAVFIDLGCCACIVPPAGRTSQVQSGLPDPDKHLKLYSNKLLDNMKEVVVLL